MFVLTPRSSSFAHWRTAVAILAVMLVVLMLVLVLVLRGRQTPARVAWTVSEPEYSHLAGVLLTEEDEF
jgi:anti-sigma-K factor RskA